MALMKQAVIPEFFARLKKAIPEPETELEYDNVYQLLVAVVEEDVPQDRSLGLARNAGKPVGAVGIVGIERGGGAHDELPAALRAYAIGG